MNLRFLKSRPGFTLIELLLVIGIVAILAVIVIVAINPNKPAADARNTQRRQDVNTIINAVYQHAIDNSGELPGCLPAAVVGDVYNVCTASTCEGVTNGCDLSMLVEKYIKAIPVDPSGATGEDSHYDITKEADGRITVTATAAENDESIAVSR